VIIDRSISAVRSPHATPQRRSIPRGRPMPPHSGENKIQGQQALELRSLPRRIPRHAAEAHNKIRTINQPE
jgi:topoisomerase IA-like protein